MTKEQISTTQERTTILHSDCLFDEGDCSNSGVVGDLAGVGAVGKADVAALSPGGAPGVADLPVAGSGRIHAHGLHTVIHGSWARGHHAVAVPACAHTSVNQSFPNPR